MSLVVAPADKRFRRSHVKPARRRSWLRLLVSVGKYGALAVLLTYAAYRTTSVVGQARALQIDRILVRGNQRLSNNDVLAVLQGMRGENLVWTNLADWRARLLTTPWVRDAALRRSLPSTVEVLIAERQPIGVGRVNNQLYLIDEIGSIIDEYGPEYADLDLPIVDGLGDDSKAGTAVDAAKVNLAARVITSLTPNPTLSQRLSQVDVSDGHNAAVILTGDTTLLFLGEDRFLPRLQSYLELSGALHERVSEIDYVDLRFDERIYVRPTPKGAGGGSVASTRQRASSARTRK